MGAKLKQYPLNHLLTNVSGSHPSASLIIFSGALRHFDTVTFCSPKFQNHRKTLVTFST